MQPRQLTIALTVLHTSPTFQPGSGEAGGLNVYLLNSSRALAERGHDITLITRKDDPDLPDVEELGKNLRLVYLDAGPAKTFAKGDSEQLIEPFTEALRTWWRDKTIDVVHSHHWFAGVATIPVAREHGVRHVQSYHSVAAPQGAGWGAGEQPESAGRISGEQFIADHSDRIIAVSNFEKQTIIERYGTDPEKFAIVPPGVDTDVFQPVGRNVMDDPYAVFAARLQPLKGVDLAIRALSLMPPDTRPRLLITGEPASDYVDYVSDVRTMVKDLGVESKVEFSGSRSREDLAELLAGAIYLLNPSHSETYGIINVEAAACGTPVIATEVGGMVESVQDGKSGYLIPSRDAAQWARIMEKILHNPDLHKELSEGARAFALSRGWSAVAEELDVVYQGEVE